MSQNTPSRYHPLQVSLHWLVVLLIAAAFVLGKNMSQLPNEPSKITPLAIHMTLGIIILLAVVVRLIARFRLPQPAHATTGNAFLDRLGKLVHYALYAFVLLMAVSGISLSLQSGLMTIVFGGSGASLPADFFDFTTRLLHGFVAPSLLLLVGLHVAAALYHQFVLKDNLLTRMWRGK